MSVLFYSPYIKWALRTRFQIPGILRFRTRGFSITLTHSNYYFGTPCIARVFVSKMVLHAKPENGKTRISTRTLIINIKFQVQLKKSFEKLKIKCCTRCFKVKLTINHQATTFKFAYPNVRLGDIFSWFLRRSLNPKIEDKANISSENWIKSVLKHYSWQIWRKYQSNDTNKRVQNANKYYSKIICMEFNSE